jgi:hypothetical protein
MVVTQDKPLAAMFRQIGGGAYPPVVETFERGKTIFFPGDPAERVYFLVKGAVKLSRVYEAGEEITVALLRENSVFGVLSLITGQRADRFYHAVAFTPVELLSVPIEQVEKALKDNPELSMLMLKGLSSSNRDDDRDVSSPRYGISFSQFFVDSLPRFWYPFARGSHDRPQTVTPGDRRSNRLDSCDGDSIVG